MRWKEDSPGSVSTYTKMKSVGGGLVPAVASHNFNQGLDIIHSTVTSNPIGRGDLTDIPTLITPLALGLVQNCHFTSLAFTFILNNGGTFYSRTVL